MADTNHNTGKKRKSLDTKADIISDLPTVLLCKIVQDLPLWDAVRTSALSRKWSDLWTSVPSLVFDDHFFTRVEFGPDTIGFMTYIWRILFQHRGPLLKFALSIPSQEDTSNVNLLINNLSHKDVRDFSIYNKHNMPIEISSKLYLLAALEKLKLTTCILYTSVRFNGFPNLTILELVEVSISYNILRVILGGCPLLEKLELTDCVGLQQSNIIIDAPMLRHFVINSEFCSLEVNNGENLVSASIVMQKMPLPIASSCNDLINSLQRSSKLEMLALGGYLCRVFFREGHRPNIFHNVRDLELLSLVLDDLEDFSSTIYCIQSISNVKRLNISVNRSLNLDDNVLDYNRDWTLQHLRWATVSLRNDTNPELKLIEYLLRCSPVLEKLSVSFMTSVSQSMYSRVVMQLNKLRRASQEVVVYLDPLIIIPERSEITYSEASYE